MRIAIVSDIHGNLPALEAVAQDIRNRGADLTVNLGDSLSGPLMPLETAQYLMSVGWLCLAGNHERQILTHAPGQRGASDEYAHSQLGDAELAWLKTQQPTCQFTEDVFLCHGTPVSDGQYFLEDAIPGGTRPASEADIEHRLAGIEAPVVACGHTHIARAVRSRAGQLLCNPGSVGLPAYGATHPTDHAVETGSPDARYAILEHRHGAWHAALFSVPYDHEVAARLADQRQRPDWAHALRTGYLPK